MREHLYQVNPQDLQNTFKQLVAFLQRGRTLDSMTMLGAIFCSRLMELNRATPAREIVKVFISPFY